MSAFVSFLLAVCLLLGSSSGASGTPRIAITGATPYPQENGVAEGTVSGVAFSLYKVAVYLKVGDSYWTKPTYAAPLTDIDSLGRWECNIDTGGHDRFGTEIVALLVPATVDGATIRCGPCCDRPLFEQAVASAHMKRPGSPKVRQLSFAGRKWSLKRTDFPYGPGPNIFSDRPQDVWVDGQGLHLTVRNRNSFWTSSEVVLSKSLGYGTYIFKTNSRVDRLNEQVVLGLFTYDIKDCANTRELDIEFAKWGDPLNKTNAQYVVQPCDACPGCGGNCTRFKVNLSKEDQRLTHYLVWSEQKVEFRTYRGHWNKVFPPKQYLVKRWIYGDQSGIPQPGRENVRFNLWLLDGNPPTNGKDAHVIISGFRWLPPEPPAEPGISIDGSSPIGTVDGYAWGSVRGVEPADYLAEVYIKVSGGWWTKPTWAEPFTPIQSDGTWRTDIVTGGHDEDATHIAAFLVPKDSDPSLAGGDADLPADLETIAVASDMVAR